MRQLRLDAFLVILDCDVLLVLQNIACVVRCRRVRATSFRERQVRMRERRYGQPNVHRAEPCEFDVPCAGAAIAVVGRW
jgi:hypothetical protein